MTDQEPCYSVHTGSRLSKQIQASQPLQPRSQQTFLIQSGSQIISTIIIYQYDSRGVPTRFIHVFVNSAREVLPYITCELVRPALTCRQVSWKLIQNQAFYCLLLSCSKTDRLKPFWLASDCVHSSQVASFTPTYQGNTIHAHALK